MDTKRGGVREERTWIMNRLIAVMAVVLGSILFSGCGRGAATVPPKPGMTILQIIASDPNNVADLVGRTTNGFGRAWTVEPDANHQGQYIVQLSCPRDDEDIWKQEPAVSISLICDRAKAVMLKPSRWTGGPTTIMQGPNGSRVEVTGTITAARFRPMAQPPRLGDSPVFILTLGDANLLLAR